MRSILKKIIVIALLLALLFLAHKKAAVAQDQGGPVTVNRIPPALADSSPNPNSGEVLETPNQRRRRLAAEAVPSPEQYPLTEAVDALREAAPKVPTRRRRTSTPPHGSIKTAGVPQESWPKTNVSQSATASEAVAMSDRWQNARNIPLEGKDGRVVYSEGGGMPTLVCAPLRLCIVELQSGEKLTGEPQIGDSVRWNVEPASYGSGELTTPMIVLKPKAVGLDTNLVITTDRRSYFLRLVSSSQDYVARISFDYPDDDRARWSKALQNQERDARKAEFDKSIRTLAASVEDLNVDYRMKGDKSIRPVRVVDDGVHTYIQMNPGVLHREAPVLAIIGPDGKAEMVNYRVQGSVYVVDRLFDRGRLILGSGRSARKADIIRGSMKDHRLFARDPFRDLANDEQKGTEQ